MMTTLSLLLLLLRVLEISSSAPIFTLNAERSIDGSPSVTVSFPDGYTDTLALTQHFGTLENRLEEGLENCNYIGNLVNEPEACVAMTGCPGKDDLEFTILSQHAEDSWSYVWRKDGSIEVVEPPSPLQVSYSAHNF